MKSCDLQDGVCIDCGGPGPTCTAEASLAELRDMELGRVPLRAVRVTSVQLAKLHGASVLTAPEVTILFPNEDPSLLGNRIKDLLTALGVPPCQGCGERAAWLNKAHLWLRERFCGSQTESNPP